MHDIVEDNYECGTGYVQVVPVGEGVIDHQKFLTTIRDFGFNRCVAYECTLLCATAAAWRRWIDTPGESWSSCGLGLNGNGRADRQ
jgi:hypothetical protein